MPVVTCATCPSCGSDLTAFEPFTIGSLGVENNGAVIWWAGHRVHLTPHERIIVVTIARAAGNAVRRHVLAEATGYEGDSPENTVAVLLGRINKTFRAIDPSFDAIENIHGLGLRWRTEDA